MYSSIKNYIKQCIVRAASPDTGSFPTVSITYHEKQTKAWHITPYGLYCNPPANSSIGLVFNIEGQEESRAAIVNTPYIRFKTPNEGEVAFGNPLTGSKVYFRSDGSIEIDAKKDLPVTVSGSANINVTGDCNLTTGGDANINVTGSCVLSASDLQLLASSILLSDSTPGAGFLALFSALKIYLDGHLHSGVQPGSGNSGPPTTTVPNSAATSNVKAK